MNNIRKIAVAAAFAAAAGVTAAASFVAGGLGRAEAAANVPLSAYADAHGFLNLQSITCANLSQTRADDADYLVIWYTGFYSGATKKRFARISPTDASDHRLQSFCKDHPDIRVISALDTLFKKNLEESMRAEN
ncbi:HdeA/HdeB family chaperone [Beijerinckia mobilis]|uniref:HdeA/HdeB family chaperone n=1 Tax=Beijerinckia mobilis TaxID=231434 RepID=UPI00068DEDB5|nr:HdeA/HdeB family chaperone [Beijerinckia mobilis]